MLHLPRTTIEYGRCKPNILDRFWSKVDRSGNCWEWTAATQGSYGNFFLYVKNGKNVTMTAHRFIDLAFNGEPKDGEGPYTLHTCDNPLCVRPSHLFRGTLKDNTQDMKSKGRDKPPVAPRGVDHHSNILTENQVREIYQRRHAGELLKDLALEFGISLSQISGIARGTKWGHLRLGDGYGL